MSDTTVTPVIGITAAVLIPCGIAWLANWYGRAVARKRWEESCDGTDQQYADCLNTVPESYREAVEMVITEEELLKIHSGER